MITLTILFTMMILLAVVVSISFSVAWFLVKALLVFIPIYLLIKIFFPRRIC